MRDTAKKNGDRRNNNADVSCSANGRGIKKDDDGSFPVKIQGAGVEPFELQVHGFWLVQDAIMSVLGREEVTPRSSVALALSGVTLDPMMELQDIKGFKAGVTLRLVEEPYSPRSAQAHLARVQEMLKAAGPQDALLEGRSPAVLNTLTQTSEAPPTLHSSKNRRTNSKTEQSTEAPPPPAYILPGVSEVPPLTTLLPTNTHTEVSFSVTIYYCFLSLFITCLVGVQFPSSESDSVELQKRLLKEAASFIIHNQIPAFMNDCIESSDVPMDGASLRQALHQKGINLRYLGHLISSISQSDLKHQLRHIKRLAFAEIVVRCAQRFFSGYIQGVETSNLSAAVSHFLCCLLVPHFSSASNGEESKKRSRRRGRGGGGATDSAAWNALSGNELWSLICQDAQETYRLKEGLGSNVDHLVEQYGLQKMSLLREMCLKTGIQLRLKEYAFDSRNKAPISPDDVLNVLPVVKHIMMTTSDATRMFMAAQNSLQKGLLEKAYEQLKEASYLFSRVCDDLHPEACHCLSLLAKVAYVQGHPAEARSVQLRVVVISERVLGFDHPNTIQQYVLLAVYLYAGGEAALAQRCLYRAKVLLLTVHGGDHPYTAVIDASLGLILQGEQSLQFLQNALKISQSFRGDADLTTALIHHLLAQRLCVSGDYRGGMNHEKEAHSIFQNKCGEDHPQTKCSSDYLRNITQQAVRVERSIRQGGAEASETPPEGLFPSQDTTLEQLALVNGILKTSYSTRMMEFKEKLKERKAAEEAGKTKQESTNENQASEPSANNGEATDEGEQANGNAERQTTGSDKASEKTDHTHMNGQMESHMHNGVSKSENEEEKCQSDIINGIPPESQSKSSIVMMSPSEAQTESAVGNVKACVVNEEKLDEE
ncbi:clustered mitochondria protein homolog [Danio aesculapii]|uniref:clustered mitochondria protein homolog n=1 Tax=Danio aesculapii TaxID=1142201 RepID=UPI0024BFA977|nr:clustered mitochondria protein homolog [Danio aesculapii]